MVLIDVSDDVLISCSTRRRSVSKLIHSVASKTSTLVLVEWYACLTPRNVCLSAPCPHAKQVSDVTKANLGAFA